jgi:hypothetical protein
VRKLPARRVQSCLSIVLIWRPKPLSAEEAVAGQLDERRAERAAFAALELQTVDSNIATTCAY